MPRLRIGNGHAWRRASATSTSPGDEVIDLAIDELVTKAGDQ